MDVRTGEKTGFGPFRTKSRKSNVCWIILNALGVSRRRELANREFRDFDGV